MMVLQKKFPIFILLGGVLLVPILTFFGRGQYFTFSLYILLAILYVGLPFLLLGLILLVAYFFSSSSKALSLSLLSFAISLAIFCQYLVLVSGNYVNQYDVQKTRTFCENLAPILEKFKQQQGTFPGKISQVISAETEVPFLLRDKEFYFSTGDSFQFKYENRSEFMFNEYIFSNTEKTWKPFLPD